ncbi:MAG: ATP-binding protein [Bacillus sp. (in: Bacteria)]|nr:ATP-binding protein [Bacillus sp. (in: firmicutes)]
MSHELRTPLNSILILSQLLYENSKGNLSEEQREHAGTIYTSGKDLLELINDILDLSKIESGKMDIYKEEVVLEDLKTFVESQFTPIANQKGLDFQIKVDSTLTPVIYTDEQRLKQILKNLLSNAFKFTNEGSVTISIEERMRGAAEMIFSVADTGIGISEEQQNTIFEAFYQGDGTTTRNYGGTGLGLSITRELAELLNGEISLESKEGEGSIFRFILPLNNTVHLLSEGEVAVTKEDTTEQPEPVQLFEDNGKKDVMEMTGQLQGKEVLIVDDDMRNVFALTSALEKHKMKVHFAENGKESIQRLLEFPTIDIVLMDIMMPVMDGYEAMEEIRKIDSLKDLPIIALTAKAMKTDREKCLAAGASDYISKPVEMNQLVSLMKVWMYKLEGEFN